MANNRLYILDTETNETFLVCKGWGDGWQVKKTSNLTDELDKWIEGRDIAASDRGSTKLKLVTEDDLPDEVKITA